MAGVYNGLQAKIKQLNSLADYDPCSAHSLNLVGECAAVCSKEGSNFFLFLQKLYTFFSASTYRWKLLQNMFSSSDNVSVERLSDTRWSARAEACSSLNYSPNAAADNAKNVPRQKSELIPSQSHKKLHVSKKPVSGQEYNIASVRSPELDNFSLFAYKRCVCPRTRGNHVQ